MGHQHVSAQSASAAAAVILVQYHVSAAHLSVAEEEILHDRHVLVHGQGLVLVLREALPLRGQTAVSAEYEWLALGKACNSTRWG
jgi:hypothetical protein